MRFPSGLKATDLTPFSCVASSPPTPQGLSSTSDVSSKLGPYHSSRHHNRHHNPVGASGVFWPLRLHALPRFGLKAYHRNRQRSTVKYGTCLKIMVSPVRVRVPPLLFCKDYPRSFATFWPISLEHSLVLGSSSWGAADVASLSPLASGRPGASLCPDGGG